MRARMKLYPRTIALLALPALAAVVYLPLINGLGFYWDDWPSVWFYHLWGPGGFLQSFASDRPALAWVFLLTTAIFRESTLGWQLFGWLARLLVCLAFWWTFTGVWPTRPRMVFWAAAIFVVYPGFSQQYIAVTYGNAFLVYTLTWASFGAMIWAYRRPRGFWPLLIIALAAQIASLAMTEYFFGLELLRPALLLVALLNPEKPDAEPPIDRRILGRAVRRWLPFLIPAVPFLIDRVFFHKTPRGDIILFRDLAADPAAALSGLVRTIGLDFVEVNLLAWFQQIQPAFLTDFARSILAILFATIAAACIIAGAAALALPDRLPGAAAASTAAHSIQRNAALQAIFLGIAAFFASGWIVWVTDLHIELLFPWDRFTLITMPSTALLIAGLCALPTRPRRLVALLPVVFIALAVGVQFQNRLLFRQEWLSQRSFLWQLAWRMPALEPGTVLLTSELPFQYYSDNSLSAPLNWMYAPDNRSTEMTYLLYDVEARLGLDIPTLDPDQPIRMRYRAVTFHGNTSQAVVIFYDPPRCLKVIDPVVDRFLPVKPLHIREMTPLSQPGLIQTDPDTPAQPPEHILGPESPHTWCYYFQKAELYGAAGDWQSAAQMADEALKVTKHFTEKNVSELFPFVEAYAHTGSWEEAAALTLQAVSIWDKTRYPLCDVWKRIAASTEAEPQRQTAIQNMEESLQCDLPSAGPVLQSHIP